MDFIWVYKGFILVLYVILLTLNFLYNTYLIKNDVCFVVVSISLHFNLDTKSFNKKLLFSYKNINKILLTLDF